MSLEVTNVGRSVGDIFFTLRKDSTINGAVPANGTEYSLIDFPTEANTNSIGYLLANGLLSVVNYVEYDKQIKTNGCCASFGYDELNGMFKVPTIQNIHIKAGDAALLAKYVAPGLPNITGSIVHHDIGDNITTPQNKGALYAVKTNGLRDAANGQNGGCAIYFDASRSNSIYGASDSVEVASVVLRPMVQVSAGALYSSGSSSSGSEDDLIIDVPEINLPYVFIPGTEAKATEVNANFDCVVEAIKNLSASNAVVQLKGDQTITGKKTFKVAPELASIELIPDVGRNHGGYIDFHYNGEASNYTSRISESTRGYLSISQNPPEGDSSTKIATTAWVKSQSLAPTFYSSGTQWYVLYPNGWIRQGGQITVSGNTATNRLDFVVEMKDLNYNIGLSSEDVSGTEVNGTEIGWGRLDTKGFYVARNNGYAGNQRIRWSVEGWKK